VEKDEDEKEGRENGVCRKRKGEVKGEWRGWGGRGINSAS
jgi:hypothetical protein